jgi:hypothetical protein
LVPFLEKKLEEEIDNRAKHYANQYRQDERLQEYWKTKRPKEIKETKAQIDARQKAKAVLLEGQPGPYQFKAAAKLEKEIAVLSTLLPGRGRPPDLLGGYVGNLALFVKEKTGKYHWTLIGRAFLKHLKHISNDPRRWALNLATRSWQQQSKEPKGPTEIIIKLAPSLPPPSTNPLPKPENEDSKTLH